MLGDIEKNKILRRAKALLFPVRWHEPFGIAITEALASGCAVLGTPYGSLPEIVTPQVGLLSNRESELVSILKQLSWPFSPLECRKRGFEGFTHLQMAEQYLRLYKRILAEGSLSFVTPASRFLESPETLLAWETTEPD